MIYRVVLDDTIDIHTSNIDCMLLNPSIELEMNSAGSFTFTLPPTHPNWDDIKVLKSTIDVYENDELIFTGRVASIEKNWNNERVVECEGALAYFNDSIHRQMKWETPLPIASGDPTVHNFLKDILDNHNVFEGSDNLNRHIYVGHIYVDAELVTREVDYDKTLDILTRMCIDTNGGYFQIRKDPEDGKLYLDWLKDFTDESSQPASFGLNLLNFNTSLSAEDICTGVLARGATVNDQVVTLNDVELVDETTYPDMSVDHYTDRYQDILWHREGMAKFGQVVQVHDFSDAQIAWKDQHGQVVANSLFEVARKWLEEKNTKVETIEVEVAELAWLGDGYPQYKLGQIVEVIDSVHMSGESQTTRRLPMYKLSCDLTSGSKKVTLGTPPKKELTQISASNSDSSTLSSTSSSGSSGGSGSGEECKVHDVRVDGTSVVSNKVANISLTGKADVSTVNALASTVATKADTSTVTALATAVAGKQDQIEFNTQEAATEILTRLKADGTVYNLGGGTEVEANPSESATDDLETIKIGDTVYDIPGSGGSTNYGKFKCDVLFVNDPLPSPTSGTSNVSRTYTLSKSIDDYDAVYVMTYDYYSSSGATNISGKILFKPEFYKKGFDDIGYFDGAPLGNQRRMVYFTFTDSTHITTLSSRTESDVEPILYRIYGLKFENKLINRSDIYSEEERMIGRWTDGKLLYQKTIIKDLTLSSSWQNYYDLTGIDLVNVEIDKLIRDDEPIPLVFSNIGVGSWIKRDGYLKFCVQGSQASEGWILKAVTIRYTKTTDTPGSGFLPEDPQMVMMSDYYSEDEQVVGRWTDGKPIYQKTMSYDFTYSVNDWTLFDDSVSYENLVAAIPSMKAINSSEDQIMLYGDAETSPRWCVKNDHKLYYYLNNARRKGVLTIQYTKTTDTPGTGPTKGNLIYLPALYSEEEREVGVWTDGKPLYQRTYRNISITNNADNIIDSSFGTDKNICTHDIEFRGISGNYRSDYNNSINDTLYSNNNGQLVYYFYKTGSWSQLFDAVDITIQYTKTTDQPGSGKYLPDGQLAHHYSTSEKVVGTWIDGSTVYERTWSGLNINVSTDWTTTGITISNASKIIYAMGTRNDSTCCLCLNAIIQSGGVIKVSKDTSGFSSVNTITLQYTKST